MLLSESGHGLVTDLVAKLMPIFCVFKPQYLPMLTRFTGEQQLVVIAHHLEFSFFRSNPNPLMLKEENGGRVRSRKLCVKLYVVSHEKKNQVSEEEEEETQTPVHLRTTVQTVM